MRTKILLIVFLLYSTCCILHSSAQTALWSMAYGSGGNGYGAIFKMNLDGSGYARPLDFNDSTNGANPYGNLMQATNGKLYGMTTGGGSYNYGVLFSFDPYTNIDSDLLDFNDSANGASPIGNIIQSTNGKLYGMTTGGGSYNYGVLFNFDLSTNTYSKLLDFNDSVNGAYPSGSLIQASNGLLYGMAYEGGSNGDGVLFSFDPSANIYNKFLDFNGTNGAFPYGSLMQASNGKLYGMTRNGGSTGGGVLFSFDPSANTYSKLLDFNGANGQYPSGSLMQASNGKLYGMTDQGGSNGDGVLFSFDPTANTDTVLLDFNESANGKFPEGSLMQASNSKLYGMTFIGGSNNEGVLFSFDPSANTYTKLRDLNPPDGTYPYYSSFIEVANISGISELSADENLSIYPNPLTSSSTLQLNTQVTNAEVVIYDIVGKELMRKKLTGDRMEIERGSLESGIYFVRVVAQDKVYTQKLVVE